MDGGTITLILVVMTASSLVVGFLWVWCCSLAMANNGCSDIPFHGKHRGRNKKNRFYYGRGGNDPSSNDDGKNWMGRSILVSIDEPDAADHDLWKQESGKSGQSTSTANAGLATATDPGMPGTGLSSTGDAIVASATVSGDSGAGNSANSANITISASIDTPPAPAPAPSSEPSASYSYTPAPAAPSDSTGFGGGNYTGGYDVGYSGGSEFGGGGFSGYGGESASGGFGGGAGGGSGWEGNSYYE